MRFTFFFFFFAQICALLDSVNVAHEVCIWGAYRDSMTGWQKKKELLDVNIVLQSRQPDPPPQQDYHAVVCFWVTSLTPSQHSTNVSEFMSGPHKYTVIGYWMRLILTDRVLGCMFSYYTHTHTHAHCIPPPYPQADSCSNILPAPALKITVCTWTSGEGDRGDMGEIEMQATPQQPIAGYRHFCF